MVAAKGEYQASFAVPERGGLSSEAGGGAGSARSRVFTFDRVWGPDSTQGEVFEEIEPLVVAAGAGFNVCIMAHGQTGAGKTHTMFGDAGERGVSFRTMARLFEAYGSVAGEADDEAPAPPPESPDGATAMMLSGEKMKNRRLVDLKLAALEIYKEEVSGSKG